MQAKWDRGGTKALQRSLHKEIFVLYKYGEPMIYPTSFDLKCIPIKSPEYKFFLFILNHAQQHTKLVLPNILKNLCSKIINTLTLNFIKIFVQRVFI